MKLTHSEIAGLCRELALLLHAGISLVDGVFLLAEDAGVQRNFLLDMGAQMDAGMTLSEAMEQSGGFPASAIGMVHIGEESGCVEEVLQSLADFYEQRSRSRRQIRHALAYPSLIMALMLAVIGVLLIKVLPVFDDVYASLGSRLTGVSAYLLYAGQVLRAALPLLLGILAVIAVAAFLHAKCAPFREKAEAWWMANFGDRGIARRYNNANFARALAIGLSSALPLEDAVEQAGKLLEDIPGAAARCRRCAEALQAGAPLASAMGTCGFLPAAESRMLAVGIRQGSGDAVMANIADRLQEDATEALENAVSKVEPAMVLTASVLVGLILLSVMLPLMNIMSALG